MSRSRFFARDLRRGLLSVALLAGAVRSRAEGEVPPPPRREATPAEQAALRGAQWLVARRSRELVEPFRPHRGALAVFLWHSYNINAL